INTYTYNTTWSYNPIDSDQFRTHTDPDTGRPLRNPSSWLYTQKKQTADKVSVGAFNLSAELIAKVPANEVLVAHESPATGPSDAAAQPIKVFDSAYYVGADPNNPAVGDMKITFKVARPQVVSVIAQQAGSSFVPYLTKTGTHINLLEAGERSAPAMIQKAQ